MARMKIEVLAARVTTRGLSIRDRLVAFLPRYARHGVRLRMLTNARNAIPTLARLSQFLTGFSAKRPLPRWSRAPWRDDEVSMPEPDAILFADTFNRWFEPENLRDAARLLLAGAFRVAAAGAHRRPLCCGRTFLAAGLVDRARAEARRALAVLAPHARAGRPIIGLEPSCLLTLRDEWLSLGLGEEARLVAGHALLFEEFVDRNASRFGPVLKPLAGRRALVHGHCHSKAFGAFPAVIRALKTIPDLSVTPIESSCCGMAGAFGYQAETEAVSRAMAELSLLPAVRAADPHTLVVANGTSCRHQIADLAPREALHPARVLALAL
jgi:Fe-S oxidoreductase